MAPVELLHRGKMTEKLSVAWPWAASMAVSWASTISSAVEMQTWISKTCDAASWSAGGAAFAPRLLAGREP